MEESARANKLKGELESGKAAVALVYLGEDGEIHHIWSATLEYDLRRHPASEILGLHVVKMNGISAAELGGASVRLVSSGDEYKLLVAGIEDLESIPVKEPYIEVSSQDYANLKMPLLGGEILSIQVNVDEQGKLYCSNLKIQEGNTFYDLKILEYTPEIKNYYAGRPIMLRELLVARYVDLNGEAHIKFIGITEEIPKEALSKLASHPEHALLEIEALERFIKKGEEVLSVEEKIDIPGKEDQYRFPDIRTKDCGQEVLTECKHGYETDLNPLQIEDYFIYSQHYNCKVRLYIGGDITSSAMKSYVRYAIELHEQLKEKGVYVPLAIYIKGKLMSLDEVKVIVGG
ncbi:MAG: hypothetical protein QXU11_05800 [Thermoproteota archaeon]